MDFTDVDSRSPGLNITSPDTFPSRVADEGTLKAGTLSPDGEDVITLETTAEWYGDFKGPDRKWKNLVVGDWKSVGPSIDPAGWNRDTS